MYMRISEGVMDPITVTALTIDNGKDCVIFVTMDMVICRGGILDFVREKISSMRSDINVEKIVISATHSHTTPELNSSKQEELLPKEAGDIMGGNQVKALLLTKRLRQ